MSTDLIKRYQAVHQRIQQACQNANRDINSVSLLAVSKTKPVEMITELSQQGQMAFGENYLQEALGKIEHHPKLEWHFIGPIQSNKTKPIAEHFHWVHSVDRLKIAQRLSRQRPDNLPPLNVLLEVNISEEPSKAGLSPSDVLAMAKETASLPNICLRGLMAIPQATTDTEKQKQAFRAMRQLLEELQRHLPEEKLDTLSMGMSGDLEAAISEGATIVRIGTDIFGARQ